jgi:hypothetical protein
MEANSVEPYSANDVIRRIWTNFEDQNTVPDDARLSIWHVPAEKKYGIRRLWQHMEHAGLSGRRLSGAEINQLTSRFIGVPRRNASKWLLDVTAKFTERAALLRGKLAVKPASKPQSGAARG